MWRWGHRFRSQITIPELTGSRGSILVGVYPEGQAGQWLLADDFSLAKE